MFNFFNAPKLKEKIKEIKHEYELKIKEIEKDKELALKEKEFELKHFKDEEIKKIQEELTEQKKSNVILKKENEMLEKITDLNADIIDVKKLVETLINKLPEIKLSNLSIYSGDNKKSE
jgi:hypothetical protein